MDVALLLLLPLLGGYNFSITCNLFKYKTAKEDGHRLYFRAALCGAFLLIFSILLHYFLLSLSWYENLEDIANHSKLANLVDFLNGGAKNRETVPPKFPILLISIHSLFLGFIIAYLINLVFAITWRLFIRFKKCKSSEGLEKQLKLPPFLIQAIKEDDFEHLIITAAMSPMPISITTDSGKVYVGFVSEKVNPRLKPEAVTILPLMSGYRTTEGRVRFTTFYEKVYEVKGKENFKLVLPRSRMCSLNLFDIEAYELFQEEQPHLPTQTQRPLL